jgi:hypothetical protein
MDQADIRSLLVDELRALDWTDGVPKAEIVESLQDYEPLARMVGNYLADGEYSDVDAVLGQIPQQAWQDAQGSEWHGAPPITEPVPDSGYMTGAGRLHETADGVVISGGEPRASAGTPGEGATQAEAESRMHPPHTLAWEKRVGDMTAGGQTREWWRAVAALLMIAAMVGGVRMVRGRRRKRTFLDRHLLHR